MSAWAVKHHKPLWQMDSDRHHHYSYKIPAWGRTCYYTIVCNFAPRFFPFTSHYEMRKICLIWSMAIWVDKFLSEGFEISNYIYFFPKIKIFVLCQYLDVVVEMSKTLSKSIFYVKDLGFFFFFFIEQKYSILKTFHFLKWPPIFDDFTICLLCKP